MYFKNCDFAKPGSPTMRVLMSPRHVSLRGLFFETKGRDS